MNLFTNDGHLTDDALRETIAEKLDEMSRLEVAEHLSFCNPCLERYTAMLIDDTLRTPAHPLLPPLVSRIRKRATGILFNKFTTYGAAACLALALWGAGVFTQLGTAPKQWQTAAAAAAAAPSVKITAIAGDFLSGVNSKLSDALRSLLPQWPGALSGAARQPNNANK